MNTYHIFILFTNCWVIPISVNIRTALANIRSASNSRNLCWRNGWNSYIKNEHIKIRMLLLRV